MFSNIFDFSYERTGLQALGFYLCQLIVFLLLAGAVLGFFMAMGGMGKTFESQQEAAKVLGPLLGLSHALVVTIFMLKAKNLDTSRNHVLVGALAVLLGGLAGPLLSLIPVAWLSTRDAAPKLGPR